jgi:uncharacterized protein (TIGR02453 family)
MSWFVYLARCGDGSFYTGIATDPVARLAAHNAGRGARYTRSRGPVALAWIERAESQGAALRRERAIKQWPRRAKKALVKRIRSPAGSDAGFAGLRPAAISYLRQLSRNNRREWFEAHRPVYEGELREPMRALIEEVDTRLARVAPEIVGEPRRSLFRIHRDIRFSRDKSPYKTNAGCWFYHRDAGRGVGGEAAGGGAGFYFHLEPGQYFVAGGIWMPPRPTLARLREALAEDHRGLAAILRSPAFRRRFGALDPEHQLVRLPRGFASGHPAEPWLRFQSFTVSRALTESQVLSPKLPDLLVREFAALTPFVRWLNGALGYPAAASRL